MVDLLGKFNNDGFIDGTIAATNPTGLIRFGKNVYLADGSLVAADRVKIGSASSLYDVHANALFPATDAVIRGTVTQPLGDPPVIDPSCQEAYEADFVACAPGGPDVVVPAGTTQTSLAPGVYGDLVIDDGGTLQLPDFGTYTFCSIRMDKYSAFRPAQQITVNSNGNVSVGAGAIMRTNSGLPFVLNVGGPLLRISQGAIVNASIRVPFGKVKIQRDGTIQGCTCAGSIKTDKHVSLLCVDGG